MMLAGALLGLCAASPAALAATESLVTLRAGNSTPTGDYNLVARRGVMAGLGAGYRAMRWLETGLDLTYFRNVGNRDRKALEIIEPTTGNVVQITLAENWTLTEFGLYGKAYVMERGRLAPYLRIGAGAYNVNYRLDVSVASATTTAGGSEQQGKFGLSAGVGARYRVVGGTSLGVEALYHNVLAKDTNVTFWTTGVTLGFGPSGK
jgi:opacity protein-like surface antigen